jgi:hypothetical protein
MQGEGRMAIREVTIEYRIKGQGKVVPVLN